MGKINVKKSSDDEDDIERVRIKKARDNQQEVMPSDEREKSAIQDVQAAPSLKNTDGTDSAPGAITKSLSDGAVQNANQFYEPSDGDIQTPLFRSVNGEGGDYSGSLSSLTKSISGFTGGFFSFFSSALSSSGPETTGGLSAGLSGQQDSLSNKSVDDLYASHDNSYYAYAPARTVQLVSGNDTGGGSGGSGGGSDPDPAPQVDIRYLTDRFSTAKSYGWYVLNNGYDDEYDYGTDYTIHTSYNAYNLTDGTVFSWSYPQNQLNYDAIRAYPSVAFGNSPFDGDGYDPAHVFPIAVNDLDSMKLVYDVDYGGDTNGFNVSYDIWFTATPGDTVPTNEVMIWLHQGDVDPYGTLVGTYSDGTYSGSIYHVDTYTAIIPDQDYTSGSIDLANIIQALIGLGIISSTEYLGSVYLGAEVVEGAGSLTINSLEFQIGVDNGAGGDTSYVVTGAGVEGYEHITDVYGTSGDDTITADIRDNVMYGGDGDDTLAGNEGNDTIHGGNGNDVLFGDEGNDILIGGDGYDTLFGGSGADTFVFDVLTSTDWIIDFDVADGDKIDLTLLLTNYDPLTDAIADFVQITDDGTDTSIAVDIDGGGDNFVQVAGVSNVTGLTDVQALVNDGTLIVSA